jgi:peptidoglycan/xylan/chitin deacetylase (PgdA/CDA1 family)
LLSEPKSVATECQRLPCLNLLYHELRPVPCQYSYVIETRLFESHADLIARVQGNPGQTVSGYFTFDDGNASDFEYALPVLVSRMLRARFFITVGKIGKTRGHMGWPQVRSLSDAGHMIGAHGWSHALLTHCSARELDLELTGSRKMLEDKLGIPITSMSLPGGRYNGRVLAACQAAGYTQVYTSVPQLQTASSEFTVGRVNVSAQRSADWIFALLQPRSRELAKLRRQYGIKRAFRMFLGDRAYEKLWSGITRRFSETETEQSAADEDITSN